MKNTSSIIIILLLVAVGGFILMNTGSKDKENVIVIESPQQDVVVEVPVTEPNERIPSRFVCVGEYCDGSMDVENPEEVYTVVNIPLIRPGDSFGCGVEIFFAPHAVAKTTTPLTATYELLFDLKASPEIPEDGFHNTVGTYTQLFFDSVNVNDGVAMVYLSGNMYGPGHCSIPELREQISQAALGFETVSEVRVHLNDEIYDWCEMDASDGEGSCPEEPQLWIDSE